VLWLWGKDTKEPKVKKYDNIETKNTSLRYIYHFFMRFFLYIDYSIIYSLVNCCLSLRPKYNINIHQCFSYQKLMRRENNISKISFNFQYLCNDIDLYTDYKLLKNTNYTEFKTFNTGRYICLVCGPFRYLVFFGFINALKDSVMI